MLFFPMPVFGIHRNFYNIKDSEKICDGLIKPPPPYIYDKFQKTYKFDSGENQIFQRSIPILLMNITLKNYMLRDNLNPILVLQ